MYADPAHIRKHTIKLSLSDREYAELMERSRLTGQQPAALARDLILERLKEIESHEANVSQAPLAINALLM